MRVSLRWLADYVDLVVSPEELAERLTMSGTEVSEIIKIGANWGKVYVGEVISRAPHPNADRLQLVNVNYGEGREITVVTGATNIKEGDRVPLALVGAKLIDTHSPDRKEAVLKPSKIRGVPSEGMLVSSAELGLDEEHSGIYILPPHTPLGVPVSDILGDTILELDLTANRSDLLSMLGVAREVAALTGQQMRMPEVSYSEAGIPADQMIKIDIADPVLCPRYSATVITGVTIKESPEWMQQRLIAAGQRPINNIVDVTNFVMLEWGQPLHAFDYDKIRQQHIIVRRSRSGETMTTLDGTQRDLTEDTLVIADAEGAVALAGVMGGLESEVTESTKTILLESASFNQVSIRRTARRFRLPSEASRRFERGQPVQQTIDAARRASQLMQQLGGGTVAPGVADTYPSPQPERVVTVTTADIKKLLGIAYPVEQIVAVLENLGFGLKITGETIEAIVPQKRLDVNLPVDIIEEVARVIGYDTIPTTSLSTPIPEQMPNKELQIEQLTRRTLVGIGFNEIITYSLTSREKMSRLLPSGSTPDAVLQAFGDSSDDNASLAREITERLMPLDLKPLEVFNPLAADAEVLRTTAWNGALETLSNNLRHFDKDVNLFEIGRIYLARDGELPEERRVLTIIMSAFRSGRQWGEQEENDFFDLKGAVETMMSRLGITNCHFVPVSHPTFLPGRTAAITVGGSGKDNSPHQVVGVIGQVNDRVLKAFDISQPAYMAAFDMGRLIELADTYRLFKPIAKFPAVLQDIAVVVEESVLAGQVFDIISRAGGNLVRNIELFDVYRGAPLPEGQKSLAYHITYQAPNRTLTDKEVAQFHERIQKSLRQQLNATFRE